MATDPDTGVQEGDIFGKTGPGKDQNDFTHTDSGNSGGSKTRDGRGFTSVPGTAGSVPEGNRHTGGQE